MTDKELDEAIALYDSGKLCNTGGKCNDVAWQAARELQSLRKGKHQEMVLVPVKIVDMLWIEADEYHIEQECGLCAVIPMDKYNFFVDWYDEFDANRIAAARKDGV